METAKLEVTAAQVQEPRVEVLAYTAEQVCAAIQIDLCTPWRLEKRGLIRRVSGIGRRRYAVAEVRRFLAAA